MGLLRRRVRVRLDDVPDVVDAGDELPVRFTVEVPDGGVLRCEVSLWCVLRTPTTGLSWPPEVQGSAEVIKGILGPGEVPAGSHELLVALPVPPEARATVETPGGSVHYEVNAVAIVGEDEPVVANRAVRIRSTSAESWIPAEEGGDGPWTITAEAEPVVAGEPLDAVVRVDGAEGAVEVEVRLEHYGEEAERGGTLRWQQTVPLGLLELPVEAPVRIAVPEDALPTVVTATFAERWRLVVTVAGGGQVRQLVQGVAVLPPR